MALLAQKRRTPSQQIGDGGPVRLVAKRAVLGHRLVTPDEGTALFRMTLEAGVVDGVADHHLHPGGAVRIMTIRADDLALKNGVP